MVMALGVTGLLRLPVLPRAAGARHGLHPVPQSGARCSRRLGLDAVVLRRRHGALQAARHRASSTAGSRSLALIGLVADACRSAASSCSSRSSAAISRCGSRSTRGCRVIPRRALRRSLLRALYLWLAVGAGGDLGARRACARGGRCSCLALPLAARLAFLSWHLVEQPALRLKPRGARTLPRANPKPLAAT